MKGYAGQTRTDGGVVAPALSGHRNCVMRENFHENFAGAEVKPASERATGLVFAAVAMLGMNATWDLPLVGCLRRQIA